MQEGIRGQGKWHAGRSARLGQDTRNAARGRYPGCLEARPAGPVGVLHKQGVQFRSLTDSIDTGTPSGRFFFHVMASLAEMERELTVERTRAGLEIAKQLGRKGGRKPKMTDSKIESAKKLLASGVPPKDVAKNLGVSIPTLYRWVPASTHA